MFNLYGLENVYSVQISKAIMIALRTVLSGAWIKILESVVVKENFVSRNGVSSDSSVDYDEIGEIWGMLWRKKGWKSFR